MRPPNRRLSRLLVLLLAGCGSPPAAQPTPSNAAPSGRSAAPADRQSTRLAESLLVDVRTADSTIQVDPRYAGLEQLHRRAAAGIRGAAGPAAARGGRGAGPGAAPAPHRRPRPPGVRRLPAGPRDARDGGLGRADRPAGRCWTAGTSPGAAGTTWVWRWTSRWSTWPPAPKCRWGRRSTPSPRPPTPPTRRAGCDATARSWCG